MTPRCLAEILDPRTQQAVAALEPVIEKRQRAIRGKRGQPQRQASKLHGHRIDIHAIQTAFCDRASNGCPLGLADVSRTGVVAISRGAKSF